MANLIIKSSADNLVLQGSDASPAITVGATGTTTFAENATLSGTANNLGTVTAGTYNATIGSSATFPTGHVLQVVSASDHEIVGHSGNNNWETKSALTIAITPLATSSIFLMGTFMGYTASNTVFFDFYKNASDVTETYNLSGVVDGHSNIYGTGWFSQAISFIDPLAENSATEKTYSLSMKSDNDQQIYLGQSASDKIITITAMELAV
jgi:hypothetical protein